MDNMTTSALIKKLCKAKNVSVKKLLESCQINRNFIYDLEHKEAAPTSDKMERIADYLNCSVDYLLGRTDVPQWEIKKAPPESGAEEYGQNINTNDISPEDIKELVKWIKSQKTKD